MMTVTADVEGQGAGRRSGVANAVRNGLAGFGIFACFTVLAQGLANLAWLGLGLMLVTMGLGALLTSGGKAWRAKLPVRIPGWAILAVAIVPFTLGTTAIEAAQTKRQHRLFATNGDEILALATSALRRGDVSEAERLLDPIDDIELPQVAALKVAADAVTAAAGNVDVAQQTLLARSRKAPNNAQLAQAAKALEMTATPKPVPVAQAPAPTVATAQPPVTAPNAAPAEPTVEDAYEGLPPPSKATASYVRKVLATWSRLQACRTKASFRSVGLDGAGPCGDLNGDLARLQADPQALEAMRSGFDCQAGDVRTVALSYALGEQGPETSRFREFIGKKMQACVARLR